MLTPPGPRLLFCATLLALSASRAGAQAEQRDVLAGHVYGPNGPLAGATVTVRNVGSVPSVAGTPVLSARTDAEGRWLIAVDRGTGLYAVRGTAIGMQPSDTTAERREPRKVIVVDMRLRSLSAQLDTVKVVAVQRPRPPRQEVVPDRATGGTERAISQFLGTVPISEQGNLAEMAASIPGVTLVPDLGGGPSGFSVLGLSADQNRITLNGLSFGGGAIPRDAVASTRVTPISFDVSRGGFSGAQLSVQTIPGGNFASRFLHLTLDQPTLQATDAAGRQLSSPYSNTQVSGSALGSILPDRLYYSASFQAGRRASDLVSLTTTDALALHGVGVSRDSLAALLSAVRALGVPLSGSTVPADRSTLNGSFLGRLDWRRSEQTSANLVVSARRSTTRASFLGANTALSHGGETTLNGVDLTSSLFTYLPGNFLNELRLGARVNELASAGYSDLPELRVRVNSPLDDGSLGMASLEFGGNASLPRGSHTSGGQLYDMFSWSTIDGRHRMRVGVDARVDRFSQTQYPESRGVFTFNSIADIAANRPASFTRSLVGQNSTGRGLTQALWFGDDWRPVERATIIYGLRLDANQFLDHPAANPAIASRFGARTDFTPSVADLSPRVGFFRAFGDLGTIGVPGFGTPWGSIRGGIGLFRNDVPATLIAPALLATGLPDAVRRLTCVGSAVPVPDWAAYANDGTTIPTSCLGGGTPSPFVSQQPNVFLIDESFAAQRSWRSNLALNSVLIPGKARFTVEGIYSINLRQPSAADLNFSAVPLLSLASEGGRPVYVAPSSIVRETGALTIRDSRVDSLFGNVTSLRTDLRSRSEQLLLTVSPEPGGRFLTFTQWQLAYVYQRVQAQSRGFGGTTAGNPLDVTWARGSQDLRHQITATFTTHLGSLLSLATTARFSSGLPFTPLVSSDINGDGFANDRAFVYDPASADSAVRSGMTSLQAGASSGVRRCLQRQMNSIAGQNSCEGPWTSSMNAVLALNPELFRWDNRAQVSLSFTNVPAGLDALLHRNGLHGWGQPAAPDPTLLIVRGFDPATGRYAYEVNQRFGDTRSSRSVIRSPFVATFEVRLLLGQPATHQLVDQMLSTGRSRPGTRMPAAQLRARLMSSFFNPVGALLRAKDSLTSVTYAQVQQLTALNADVTARMDVVVGPTVEYLVALPERYDRVEAERRVLATTQALFDIGVDGMREARKIFSPEQFAEFPPALRSSFDEARLQTVRPVVGFFPDY